MFIHRWGSQGPRLVCVHGLTRSGADFGALGRALEPERQVLAPDVHGRGKSPPLEDPSEYNIERYASDLLEILRDCGPVDWLGTSMGGPPHRRRVCGQGRIGAAGSADPRFTGRKLRHSEPGDGATNEFQSPRGGNLLMWSRSAVDERG